MKHITLACPDRYAIQPFYADGKPLIGDAFRWGMTLKKAGSMRFRWDETNEARDTLLKEIVSKRSDFQENVRYEIVPLELIHSKTVYAVSSAGDTYGLQGDGILTVNALLMPVVTAADCMPIFFYERECGEGNGHRQRSDKHDKKNIQRKSAPHFGRTRTSYTKLLLYR